MGSGSRDRGLAGRQGEEGVLWGKGLKAGVENKSCFMIIMIGF
jgi:hypothetical protein